MTAGRATPGDSAGTAALGDGTAAPGEGPGALPDPWLEAYPLVPASAGAMIFDRAGRLLILKPTYKSGWTIPGGVMEAGGESPWQACRREVREETGLDITSGRLACVDFRRPKPGNPGGIRFLFDCGRLSDAALRAVTLQAEEISEHRLVPMKEALALLRKPIRRRVRAARTAGAPRYLENGRPAGGVTG